MMRARAISANTRRAYVAPGSRWDKARRMSCGDLDNRRGAVEPQHDADSSLTCTAEGRRG
jgi:hypothetical protein